MSRTTFRLGGVAALAVCVTGHIVSGGHHPNNIEAAGICIAFTNIVVYLLSSPARRRLA